MNAKTVHTVYIMNISDFIHEGPDIFQPDWYSGTRCIDIPLERSH